MKKWIVGALLVLISNIEIVAAELRSPFNGMPLNATRTGKNCSYSFLAAGHAYGKHGASIKPSRTLLRSISKFNEVSPDFLMLLGDFTQRATAQEYGLFNTLFASKVGFPIFNAVGNHELGNKAQSDFYEDYFGATFYAFRLCSDLFIVLDSERNNGLIEKDQMKFVDSTLSTLAESPKTRNIFIFSHRLIWAAGNPPLEEVIPYTNGPGMHPKNANMFSSKVLPQLKKMSAKIFFFSGDFGQRTPLFYYHKPGTNVTYLGAGMYEQAKDAVILVEVDVKSGVQLRPISLTGVELPDMPSYNLDYVKKNFAPGK